MDGSRGRLPRARACVWFGVVVPRCRCGDAVPLQSVQSGAEHRVPWQRVHEVARQRRTGWVRRRQRSHRVTGCTDAVWGGRRLALDESSDRFPASGRGAAAE
eukprot:ctg_1678.g508